MIKLSPLVLATLALSACCDAGNPDPCLDHCGGTQVPIMAGAACPAGTVLFSSCAQQQPAPDSGTVDDSKHQVQLADGGSCDPRLADGGYDAVVAQSTLIDPVGNPGGAVVIDQYCGQSPALQSGHAAGGSCASVGDCAAFNCGCSVGSNAYAAAACMGGSCADATTACAKAIDEHPELCHP